MAKTKTQEKAVETAAAVVTVSSIPSARAAELGVTNRGYWYAKLDTPIGQLPGNLGHYSLGRDVSDLLGTRSYIVDYHGLSIPQELEDRIEAACVYINALDPFESLVTGSPLVEKIVAKLREIRNKMKDVLHKNNPNTPVESLKKHEELYMKARSSRSSAGKPVTVKLDVPTLSGDTDDDMF